MRNKIRIDKLYVDHFSRKLTNDQFNVMKSLSESEKLNYFYKSKVYISRVIKKLGILVELHRSKELCLDRFFSIKDELGDELFLWANIIKINSINDNDLSLSDLGLELFSLTNPRGAIIWSIRINKCITGGVVEVDSIDNLNTVIKKLVI